MNQNIIVYSLFIILFILVIYLLKQVSEQNSSNNNNNQPPTSTNPAVDFTNYYNKSQIDNLINNSSSGNPTGIPTGNPIGDSIKYATFQELGYDINFDNTINFNHPVNFNNPVDFNHPVDFNNPVDFNDNISINYENTLINTLPPGSIIAWNSDTIPKGWALCDGQRYILDSDGNAIVDTSGGVLTPDLKGRFILGAGEGEDLANRTLGDTSGAETHTLNVSEMPYHSHQHLMHYSGNDNVLYHNDTHKFASGNHTAIDATWKTGGIESTGGNSAHNNMPPYYVLTYIMKI